MEPPVDAGAPGADYESTPLTRAEYITAIVHLYRGELYRANSWRLRLDNTTNWAILTTAAILTFAFGPGHHSHWIVLLGLALISVFLGFEARRFRFWHVWRSRVRMIEENFYGPILRRDPVSPDIGWGELVAQDLFQPTFKISRLAAVRARFTRNYWAIYSFLGLAWTLKVLVVSDASFPAPDSWVGVQRRLAEGMIPWWVPLVYLGTFLAAFIALLLCTPRPPRNELEYWRSDVGTEGSGSPMDL